MLQLCAAVPSFEGTKGTFQFYSSCNSDSYRWTACKWTSKPVELGSLVAHVTLMNPISRGKVMETTMVVPQANPISKWILETHKTAMQTTDGTVTMTGAKNRTGEEDDLSHSDGGYTRGFKRPFSGAFRGMRRN